MRQLARFGLILSFLVATGTAVAGANRLGPTPPGTPRAPQGVAGIVGDPSFEAGTPNPVWSEASTTFGTPLCNFDVCGAGTSLQPARTGDWWAWFGGVDAAETGEVSQTITLPNETVVNLNFGFQAPICSGLTADFIEARINGTAVWRADGVDALCGNAAGYTPVSVNISQFRGQSVVLSFNSTVVGGGANVSNFFIDDVSVGSSSDVPALSNWSILAGVLLLGLLGTLLLRRQH